MTTYTLNINGQARRVDVAADTPLLWVLRDSLGMVGTKFGCGVGQCGACTVQLDGVPTRGCLTPVSEVGRRSVTTIEGLDPKGAHPLQRAWQELDVPQCGYCQGGQLLTAAALLKRKPRPSDAEITEAMSGNLCRCATYVRIHAAVRRAADIIAGAGAPTGANGKSANRDTKEAL